MEKRKSILRNLPTLATQKQRFPSNHSFWHAAILSLWDLWWAQMSILYCLVLSGCAGQVKISDLVANILLYLYAKTYLHRSADCWMPHTFPGMPFNPSVLQFTTECIYTFYTCYSLTWCCGTSKRVVGVFCLWITFVCLRRVR